MTSSNSVRTPAVFSPCPPLSTLRSPPGLLDPSPNQRLITTSRKENHSTSCSDRHLTVFTTQRRRCSLKLLMTTAEWPSNCLFAVLLINQLIMGHSELHNSTNHQQQILTAVPKIPSFIESNSERRNIIEKKYILIKDLKNQTGEFYPELSTEIQNNYTNNINSYIYKYNKFKSKTTQSPESIKNRPIEKFWYDSKIKNIFINYKDNSIFSKYYSKSSILIKDKPNIGNKNDSQAKITIQGENGKGTKHVNGKTVENYLKIVNREDKTIENSKSTIKFKLRSTIRIEDNEDVSLRMRRNTGADGPLRRTRNGPGWKPLSKDLLKTKVSVGRHTVSLLGLFELSTRSGMARPEGRSELAAAQLAVRHVNAKRLLPGYTLRLLTNDTKCDPGVGVDRFFHALYTQNTTRMVMLLGSACSEVTESLAKVVPYWNIVQVSFGSTSPALSDRNEFPLFYRTVAPDSSHNPARIAFIRKFGWDTVTALSQNEEVYSLAVNGLLTELESANITCAAAITFAETDFREQLKLLKDLDTRIIVGSFSPEMTPKIFCEAYNLGMYGADYAWIIQATSLPSQWKNSSACPSSHLEAAIERLILVSSHNSIVEDEMASLSGLTNKMFTSAMESSGAALSPYAPQTYDAVWAIALALRGAEDTWQLRKRTADANDSSATTGDTTARLLGRPAVNGLGHFDYTRKDMAEMFLQQLGQLNFLGVSGPVSFSGADRIGTSAFYQVQDGSLVTVAFYHPRTGALDASCGACRAARWSQSGQAPVARRTLRRSVRRVAQPARAAIAALAGAGVALALAALVLNTHYSKLKSIKLSSPRLNNMTIVGCVFVYIAVVLLGLDHATLPTFIQFSALCTARVYLLSAGFSLAFGSMFAKTYRVHRILISNRSGVCKTKLLQDTQLISLICALLLIDGLIVTLWVAVDPMERHLKNLTIEISALDRSVVYQPQIEVCRSQHTNGWLGALYAYKGLLLVVGVYMAWETRNVKISALNDSQYIGISVYSVVITSAIVVVLANLISERATLAYVTITGLILMSTTATLCLLFLPKLLSIMDKSDTTDPVVESMGLRIECNTRRFVNDDKQELHYRVEIQNKVYKREMAALDREINRLEKLLDSSTSTTSSSTSLHHKKMDHAAILEIPSRKQSRDDRVRTPSIGGGLPLLLLSVLPPVIPRASWPTADGSHNHMRRSVTFSSQPKLNDNKSQPTIDLYSLCVNRRQEENTGLLSRLKNIFGSKPSSRKASTASIAGSSGPGIAAALKIHMGMLAGLVPGPKHHMVLSCNTLDVHNSQRNLRRESFSCSGPVINIVSDDNFDRPESPRISMADIFNFKKRDSTKTMTGSETRVNFQLPLNQRRPTIAHQISQPVISFKDRAKGSPRFPHRIVPTTGSMSQLEDYRKTSSASISHISGNYLDGQTVRRSSHQPHANKQSQQPKAGPSGVMTGRWKSMEDATLTLPGSRRGSGLLAMSYIPSNIYQPRTATFANPLQDDVWATAEKGIPLSEMDAEIEGNRTKYVRKQTSQSSLSQNCFDQNLI